VSSFADTTIDIKPVRVFPDHAGDDVHGLLGRLEVERTDDNEVRVQVYTAAEEDGYDYETTVYLSLERASQLMAALGKAILA
jgi:hypothetical protein